MDWRNRISRFYLEDTEKAQLEITVLNEHLSRLEEQSPGEWHTPYHIIRLRNRMKAIFQLQLSSISNDDLSDAENDIFMGLLLRDESLVSRGRERLYDIFNMLERKE